MADPVLASNPGSREIDSAPKRPAATFGATQRVVDIPDRPL